MKKHRGEDREMKSPLFSGFRSSHHQLFKTAMYRSVGLVLFGPFCSSGFTAVKSKFSGSKAILSVVMERKDVRSKKCKWVTRR